MAFPDEKELKKIRKKLEKADPSLSLPKNATQVERFKYALCQKFVIYLLEHKVSQAELARSLDMDPARLNEIIKYKISLFTIDKLVEFTQRLDPELEIYVA